MSVCGVRGSVREVIVPFQGQCSASACLVLIVGDYFRFADRWGDRNVIIDIRKLPKWIYYLTSRDHALTLLAFCRGWE